MAGLLSRLLRRSVPETRAGGFYGPVSGLGGASPFINPRMAENLSAVTACINVIGTGLASLPAAVYRQQEHGRIEAPNHPVARLIRAPNDHQTWPDWIEWVMGQVLLWGNALAAIEYDGAGRPTALTPIPWQNVSVALLNGRLAYDVIAYASPWGGTGLPRRFLADEVFHLKDRSDDGWLGRSRLSRAPDVLAAASGLQTFSASLWANAAMPSGAVTVPSNITPAGMQRMREWFDQQYTGAQNGGRTLFLDAGSDWKSLSIDPESAEVLASRRFTVEELCRLFQVPPPLVQSYEFNTFTNSAQAELWFASRTLLPWARKIEAEFARSVFADPSGAFHLEIDLSGLTRGDYSTRWTANVAAVAAGILTADEVREAEGYAPRPAAATPAPAPVIG